MPHTIKVRDEDYKRLKTVATKTHRTISGTISYLLATSGLFKD